MAQIPTGEPSYCERRVRCIPRTRAAMLTAQRLEWPVLALTYSMPQLPCSQTQPYEASPDQTENIGDSSDDLLHIRRDHVTCYVHQYCHFLRYIVRDPLPQQPHTQAVMPGILWAMDTIGPGPYSSIDRP